VLGLVKPFLKWVGGKRALLGELKRRIPPNFGCYVEPFCGGGALFFALQLNHAILSDINGNLIATYICVRDDPHRLLSCLRNLREEHSRENFYRAREKFLSTNDIYERGALMIYLNKTCFNGLYRVNLRGCFNAPFGKHKTITIDEDNIIACSNALQNVDIRNGPYHSVEICKDYFYYLDPPYHLAYTKYDTVPFGELEHRNLGKFCQRIHRRGGKFMLSNGDTPLVRNLYENFHIEEIMAPRNVAANIRGRGYVRELLIRNYC
jgi:DNA adenine methylase